MAGYTGKPNDSALDTKPAGEIKKPHNGASFKTVKAESG
jgi:hypothetical protein